MEGNILRIEVGDGDETMDDGLNDGQVLIEVQLFVVFLPLAAQPFPQTVSVVVQVQHEGQVNSRFSSHITLEFLIISQIKVLRIITSNAPLMPRFFSRQPYILLMKKRNPHPTNLTYEEDDSERTRQQLPRCMKLRQTEALALLNGNIFSKHMRCRDQEITKIRSVLEEFFQQKNSGSKRLKLLLVTGAPGAGKTLTLTTLFSQGKYEIMKFNGNTTKSLWQIQEAVALQLLGCCPKSSFQLEKKLESWKPKKPVVVYIEEIENILRENMKAENESFFHIFSKIPKIALLGVSNTIDLLEKCETKMKVDCKKVVNVVFKPYSVEDTIELLRGIIERIEQVSEIKIDYPQKLMNFTATKLQIINRGDFRISLQFLKKVVIDLFNTAGDRKITDPPYQISMQNVSHAFERIKGIKDTVIPTLPFEQQIALIALCLITERTDALSVDMTELTKELKWICSSLHLQFNNRYITLALPELAQYGCVKMLKRKGKDQASLTVGMSEVRAIYENHAMLGKLFKVRQSDK